MSDREVSAALSICELMASVVLPVLAGIALVFMGYIAALIIMDNLPGKREAQ